MSEQSRPAKPATPASGEHNNPDPSVDPAAAQKSLSAVQEAAAAQSVTVFIPPHGVPKPPPAPPKATVPAATTQTAVPTQTASSASREPAASSFASSLAAKPTATTTSGQQKCGTCGHLNRAGLLICENCGTSLVAAAATILGTQKLDKNSPDGAPAASPRLATAEVNALASAGANEFTDTMILRLEVESANMPILVYPKEETSLGRRDPAGGTMPDVDLTSYAAYRLGVSRRHALLKLKDEQLNLVDLGSSNGTMLNGVKLAPHQPRALRDGDTITLGKMTLRVIFQSAARR